MEICLAGVKLPRPMKAFIRAWPLLLWSLYWIQSSAMADGTQTAQRFTETRTFTTDYLLYLPAGYDARSGKVWPLILFLHGVGERGSDVWLVAKHGPPKVDTQMTNFPFIVVSPQCPDGKLWSNDQLLSLLDDVEKRYAVDSHRVYLTGLSMGGFGTWSLGLSHPDRFAALAPLCGGGDYITPYLLDDSLKPALRTLPIWAFHGGKDTVVPMIESERMIAYMRKFGDQNVKLTIYPNATHDCWTQTYGNQALFDWFLQHRR
jgi:predicted peptidase